MTQDAWEDKVVCLKSKQVLIVATGHTLTAQAEMMKVLLLDNLTW